MAALWVFFVVRLFVCLFKKRSYAFLSKEHPSFVKCNKNSGWHTGLVLKSEWKFSRAGDTTLDPRGSDRYQELNSWFFFFHFEPHEIHLLIHLWNFEFFSSQSDRNLCLGMLQAVTIIVHFVQTWSGLSMCDISLRDSGFQIFFSGLQGTWNKCGNHTLLRKFLSTLLPPKCT